MIFVLRIVLLASVWATGTANGSPEKVANDGKRSTFVAAAYEHLPKEALPSCYESGIVFVIQKCIFVFQLRRS